VSNTAGTYTQKNNYIIEILLQECDNYRLNYSCVIHYYYLVYSSSVESNIRRLGILMHPEA
jgi:hypothetical protein